MNQLLQDINTFTSNCKNSHATDNTEFLEDTMSMIPIRRSKRNLALPFFSE